MWPVALVILGTIFLYVGLKKIAERNFIQANNNYQRFLGECDKLSYQNSQLKDVNAALEKTLEETTALYDITRQICKTLDENEIFNNFCSQIKRYARLGECKFIPLEKTTDFNRWCTDFQADGGLIPPQAASRFRGRSSLTGFIREEKDLSPDDKSTVLPLRIAKIPIGYLVATQIKEGDKDKFYILAQQFLLGLKRALLYQRVNALAITDSLTGVFSRRYLMERLSEEIERSKKFKYSFSFLMLDIDHFKAHNDRYGHLVGDAILREVSQTIKENIRQIDLVGRYGGEEFSVILTETDKEGARFAAERMRSSIENKRIRIYDEELAVTISIGISIFPQDAQEQAGLIEKADEALYQAKRAGRNRVEMG